MSNTWQTLLANLAIIAIFVSIWTHLEVPAERIRRSLRTASLAVLLGGATSPS